MIPHTGSIIIRTQISVKRLLKDTTDVFGENQPSHAIPHATVGVMYKSAGSPPCAIVPLPVYQ